LFGCARPTTYATPSTLERIVLYHWNMM